MIPELLAPAGSLEALRAAICAGADAVYLGAASFGARAAVGFSPDELKEAIRFAHLHRRKIYVTVNTLVKNDEWNELRTALRSLRDLRADAILIQDLGVLDLCRHEFPELILHASTQMSLHTPSGIRWAMENGIRRVVLNREATIEEIRNAAATGAEIEVFAHGALCVSMSGQCALSASLGERSGNRGRCAQPCRLSYQYRGEEKAWLSPADLCTLPILQRLRDAGVASLKLEGRLKRPEYVYIVTDIYRRALDRLDGHTSAVDETADNHALHQIFCRGRFTEGYAGDRQDAGILNPGHTAHEGVLIGRIDGISRRGDVILGSFTPGLTLHDQDGLSIGDDKCIYTGPDVPAGHKASVRLHRTVDNGSPVFRTESAEQLAHAQSMYGAEGLKRLKYPFNATFTAHTGEPASLTVESNGLTAHIMGPVCEAAQHKPLNELSVRQSLEKTGDTPFYLKGLTVDLRDAYLASAQLNAMRRDALSLLESACIEQNSPHYTALSPTAPCFIHAKHDAPPAGRFYVRTENPDDIPDLLGGGADRVILFPRDLRPEALDRLSELKPFSKRVIMLLPRLASDAVLKRLAGLAESHGFVLAADNAGHLGFSSSVCMAAEGIPVFNHYTEQFLYEQGVQAAVLSSELSGTEIAALPDPILERVLCVYGRQQLMLLRHCPERVYRGLDSGHADCRLCESGNGLYGQCLTDRKGMRLPLIPYRADDGCVVRLYSAKPVSLLSYMPDLRRLPVSFLLSFTDEPIEKCLAVLRAFKHGAPCSINGTTGHYLNSVL